VSRGKPATASLSSPTIQANGDGRLEIFAAGNDNAIYHVAQTKANNGWAPPGAWSSLGEPAGAPQLFAGPVAINNQGGKLEVFCFFNDQTIDHIQELKPSGPWPPPGSWGSPLDGALPVSAPVVGRNANGLLDCFVIVAGGEVWHVTQTAIGQW
jgi:hypothetical protein